MLDNIIDFNKGVSINEAYKILANFRFRGETAFKKVKNLSGGELLKMCLAVTLGTQKQPELIILDEPTNNLDIKSIGILESTLEQYKGALLVISHDDIFLHNIKINKEVFL